jgi:predicted Zn-dependent protease
MSLMNSEAELAAVLGHEIGHVTARHSVNQVSRAQLTQLGLGLGVIVSPEFGRFADLAGTGLSLLFLKHGRDDESQADQLGFRYMLDQQYDVREMENVFAALQASGELSGRSAVPSWLASHPSEPDRIAAVRERVARVEFVSERAKVNASGYLDQIEGLVYGPDPRNGYFEDGMFYHPELAFQFKVPEEWERQNLTSAVVAVSSTRDAALQLTLADNDLADAAAEFFAQEGVVEVESQRVQVNGRNSIVSEFLAPTSGGRVRGIVAHLNHGGATLRLVTYSTEAGFTAYTSLFNDVMSSFAPVTQRDVLGIQASRIRVVELDREMTLSEFAERYPSDVSFEELAVINQAAGGTARFPRGAELKRVSK